MVHDRMVELCFSCVEVGRKNSTRLGAGGGVEEVQARGKEGGKMTLAAGTLAGVFHKPPETANKLIS